MPDQYAPQPYLPGDERSWLRCRALAFLDTSYFDDVVTRKPDRDAAVQLVVRHDGQVIGLLDVSLTGATATIESIAVHPDQRRSGIAGALLDAAVEQLDRRGAATLEAWTREDRAALAWYRRCGFQETFRYLHVYLSDHAGDIGGELVDAVRSASGLRPVQMFAHAPIEREAELRQRFHRVHVCRRLERSIRSRPT
jgi:ribosomal protein S18 acetylase RimI-like enzyme